MRLAAGEEVQGIVLPLQMGGRAMDLLQSKAFLEEQDVLLFVEVVYVEVADIDTLPFFDCVTLSLMGGHDVAHLIRPLALIAIVAGVALDRVAVQAHPCFHDIPQDAGFLDPNPFAHLGELLRYPSNLGRFSVDQ